MFEHMTKQREQFLERITSKVEEQDIATTGGALTMSSRETCLPLPPAGWDVKHAAITSRPPDLTTDHLKLALEQGSGQQSEHLACVTLWV